MKSSQQIEAEGGPAFAHGNAVQGGSSGMTLRDWFAGQALAGLMASGPLACSLAESAEEAYQNADAMLAVRAQ